MPLFKNLSARRFIGRKRQSQPTNLNDVLTYVSQASQTQLSAIRIALKGREGRYGK